MITELRERNTSTKLPVIQKQVRLPSTYIHFVYAIGVLISTMCITLCLFALLDFPKIFLFFVSALTCLLVFGLLIYLHFYHEEQDRLFRNH